MVVHWPEIACSTNHHCDSEMYQGAVERILPELVRDFSAINPHATFTVAARGRKWVFKASDPRWRKWRANDPTSAHWYRTSDLCDLIAAYIGKEEEESLPRMTLRDFVGQFDGLARPQYRKAVLEQAGLVGKYVSDLRADVDGAMELVGRLLAAMRGVAKPVKPLRLGAIGREHMQRWLVSYGVDAETIVHSEYGRVAQIDDNGLPFVLEVGFGVTDERYPRKLVCGLNHSVVFKVPSSSLFSVLRDCRMDGDEPVAIIVHQSCPRFFFTSHGKGAM